MHSLLTRLRTQAASGTPQPGYRTAIDVKRMPRLLQRQRRAPHYFDASRQTSRSFRLLIEQLKQPGDAGSSNHARNFLCLSMENLLQSIRPGMEDDEQSRRYFFSLLQMHLSHLNADEMTQLSAALKAAGFSCHVTETIIDDEMYRDHGFANGPPHSFNRTLMRTEDFFNVLDSLETNARRVPRQGLRNDKAVAVRDVLPACARHWEQSGKTPEDLHPAICLLSHALNLPLALNGISAGPISTRASTLAVVEQVLMIDASMAAVLTHDAEGQWFAELLRDLVELLVTQKLFGITAPPDQLTHRQRQDLVSAMEQIYSGPPPQTTPDLQIRARAVLAQISSPGEIQIQPTTGVALGHAWIAPALSLVPDKRGMAIDIGHRYMHSGFHLAPGDSLIREWPAHFMTAKENEEAYPAEQAWSVGVPVDARQLQRAAQAVREEWEALGHKYRFTGTTPGMSATGCRVTVWESVRRGLGDDARQLFDHYNRGLPEPESPSELWGRLDRLMRWIETLAAR